MLRAGEVSIDEDAAALVVAKAGFARLVKVAVVYCDHHLQRTEEDLKPMVETGKYRGKTWRIARVRYGGGAPYNDSQAEAF
eukprot:173884-Alexandrium_andersonii.AAC.1